MERIEEYFSTARERYRIKLRRDAGEPPPWTVDHVFLDWRFCNVHREDDKTTVWFRENIRKRLTGKKLVQATIIFRWFNRIENGERLLDLILGEWDPEEAKKRLADAERIVTGAFMVRTPDGMDKLDGVLYSIDDNLRTLDFLWDNKDWSTLEKAWSSLLPMYGIGRFLSYEIVSDLRWTHLLDKSPDIMTWANSGPGCARGLGRVMENDKNLFRGPGKPYKNEDMLDVMRTILPMSKDPQYWPQEWPAWEMREVEHWSCEFAKYCQGQDGFALKRRFSW